MLEGVFSGLYYSWTIRKNRQLPSSFSWL